MNSAALRKPHLIRSVLNELIPLLYEETVVKEELIHTVEMGPFKHKVDDGLEIRKVKKRSQKKKKKDRKRGLTLYL